MFSPDPSDGEGSETLTVLSQGGQPVVAWGYNYARDRGPSYRIVRGGFSLEPWQLLRYISTIIIVLFWRII